MWEYCAKSELHPSAAGLKMLKGRQINELSERIMDIDSTAPLGRIIFGSIPGVKTPG